VVPVLLVHYGSSVLRQPDRQAATSSTTTLRQQCSEATRQAGSAAAARTEGQRQDWQAAAACNKTCGTAACPSSYPIGLCMGWGP
jgi:hypothetical protein